MLGVRLGPALGTMTGNWEIPRRLSARYLVPAAALIASFVPDGLVREARTVVLDGVPRWSLLAPSQVGELETLGAVILILFTGGLIARRAGSIRVAAALASALAITTATAAHHDSRVEMGIRGRELVVRDFPLEEMLDKTMLLYEAILAERPA